MDITLLGTGTPTPSLERAGTSILITADNEPIMVDCGPGTVYRLIKNRIHPATVEKLFFTHHHLDHNASFFHFAIAGWKLGRKSLHVYGPEHTRTLLSCMEELYADDIEYRIKVGGRSERGITDIAFSEVDATFHERIDGWEVTALPVEHPTETYAYRFERQDANETVVYSGDTRQLSQLTAFAKDADVLIQDCTFGPVVEEPSNEGLIWEEYTEPMDEERIQRLAEGHCTPEQAGEIAADADVDTLVLTHILPYRDTEEMRTAAASVFDGEVVVGRDNLTLHR